MSGTYVVVGEDDVVRCARCGGLMEPMEAQVTVRDGFGRPWLFWACTREPTHLTQMIPLPRP